MDTAWVREPVCLTKHVASHVHRQALDTRLWHGIREHRVLFPEVEYIAPLDKPGSVSVPGELSRHFEVGTKPGHVANSGMM